MLAEGPDAKFGKLAERTRGRTMTGFTGGCACGQVRYRFTAQPGFVGHCYCRDCQLATGSAFTSVLAIPKGDLDVTGDVRSYTVAADSGRKVTRSFCGECGTPLFTDAEMNTDDRFIKLTTLDQPDQFEPQMNCWTGSAPAWSPIADAPISFSGNPE